MEIERVIAKNKLVKAKIIASLLYPYPDRLVLVIIRRTKSWETRHIYKLDYSKVKQCKRLMDLHLKLQKLLFYKVIDEYSNLQKSTSNS